MSNVVLKRARYLAEFYQLDLADIIKDCCAPKLNEFKYQTGLVYVAESWTSGGAVYKIGKSYSEGRIYQLDRQYNIGTKWKPAHIIHCYNNDFVEKVLHYLFDASRTMRLVSRELFVLAPSEVEWLKSINYVDGYRLASAVVKAHTKAVQMHGVQPYATP